MPGGFDVVIIGSGVGGGCVAHALAPTGARIAILERGARLPREERNWDPEAVYADAVYKSDERWVDGTGRAFRPGQFYYVGGHTKVFGATMFRFRREDFAAMEHAGGLSPAWPIDYETLEPWYARAERLFGVHGEAGADPTEPPRSGPYPHPPLRHNPVIAEVAERLRAQGLRPFPMPTSVQDHDGGACVRCNTCDGFPCRLGAKGDAETRLIDPVLQPRERVAANGGAGRPPAGRCERPARGGRRACRRHRGPGRSLRAGGGRGQQRRDPATLRSMRSIPRVSPTPPAWSGGTT